MNNYYDIDHILTDAQKVPCTFEINIPGLGYLAGNAGGDVRCSIRDTQRAITQPLTHINPTDFFPFEISQVKKGTQVTLPLWLASFLALQKFPDSSVVGMDLPPALAPRVLNALKANPKTVDLRAQAPHFYELAARALELFEEDEIVDVLTEVSCSVLVASLKC